MNNLLPSVNYSPPLTRRQRIKNKRQNLKRTRRKENRQKRYQASMDRRKDRSDNAKKRRKQTRKKRLKDDRRYLLDSREVSRASAMLDRRPKLQELQDKYGHYLKKSLTDIQNPRRLKKMLKKVKKREGLGDGNNTLLDDVYNGINKTWKETRDRFGKNRSKKTKQKASMMNNQESNIFMPTSFAY